MNIIAKKLNRNKCKNTPLKILNIFENLVCCPLAFHTCVIFNVYTFKKRSAKGTQSKKRTKRM